MLQAETSEGNPSRTLMVVQMLSDELGKLLNINRNRWMWAEPQKQKGWTLQRSWEILNLSVKRWVKLQEQISVFICSIRWPQQLLSCRTFPVQSENLLNINAVKQGHVVQEHRCDSPEQASLSAPCESAAETQTKICFWKGFLCVVSVWAGAARRLPPTESDSHTVPASKCLWGKTEGFSSKL